MPRQTPSKTQPAPAAPVSLFRVLLVDGENAVRRAVAQHFAGWQVTLFQADRLAEARRVLKNNAIDLILVDAELPDGSGLDLVREASQGKHATQAIVLSGRLTAELSVQAVRSGASDILAKPLHERELADRVGEAIARQRAGVHAQQRIARLRRICKKLTAARDEVSQQVDILCNDLVTAYQELAEQMHQVQQTSEFSGLVKNELDLENLLRKTMEYLLQKAGPTNAAVFLPASADEYSLGGYVNYDCTAESADMLLQHLADVVAPKLTDREEVLHITDNATLQEWIGDDAAYLADSHVVAFTCRYDGETLAVITLFRDGGQPFPQLLMDACASLGPMVGEYLARIIRIHHRGLPALEDEQDDDGGGLAA